MAKTQSSVRKLVKPEYSAEKNLTDLMDATVALYKNNMSLQAIAEDLSLNPIKVRKLLITAGVYQSDIADAVQQTFQSFRTTQDYNVSDTKNLVGDELVASAIKSAMAELGPNEVTNRTKIEPLAQQKLAESLNQKYGEGAVFINKVVINNMDFEEAYNTAIQQKSIAQQNADKQKIENEAAIAKAEADKQVAITNAEAEAQKTSIAADAQAEANRKIAESLSEPLIEYQKIQKWDGKLPTVSGSNALVSIDPAE